jgi:hypothetical protein
MWILLVVKEQRLRFSGFCIDYGDTSGIALTEDGYPIIWDLNKSFNKETSF